MLRRLLALTALPCFCCLPEDKRFRFSCIRCAERRAKRGKLKGCYYNKLMRAWMPHKYRQLSAIWYDQEAELLPTVYILFVDEQRSFRAVKDVLLNQVWRWALQNNRRERGWLLKRLVSVCENLAS